MKFDISLAEQVAKVHEISAGTLRTWEHRIAIPKKYFDTDGSIFPAFSEQITDADKYRLLQVYNLPYLNFAEIKSISLQKLADFARNKGIVRKDEYIQLKKELVNLKNKFTPVLSAKSYAQKVNLLRSFFLDPRLKPFTFAEGSEHKYAIEQLTTRKTDPEPEFVEQTIINVTLFFQSIIL